MNSKLLVFLVATFIGFCLSATQAKEISSIYQFGEYFNKNNIEGNLRIYGKGLFRLHFCTIEGIDEYLLPRLGIFKSPRFDWKDAQDQLCVHILEAKSEEDASKAISILKAPRLFFNKRFILIISSGINESEVKKIKKVFDSALIKPCKNQKIEILKIELYEKLILLQSSALPQEVDTTKQLMKSVIEKGGKKFFMHSNSKNTYKINPDIKKWKNPQNFDGDLAIYYKLDSLSEKNDMNYIGINFDQNFVQFKGKPRF